MADDDNTRPADPDASTKDLGKPSPAALPKKIGHYSIKRIIASGGMGTVYLAQQESPRRVVALKVMKKGLASKSALRRFEYESQILARLKHPNIAQVYEAGTYDDGSGSVPYFAMEYIANAKTIIDYIKTKGMGTRERLTLFVKVCDAVHHGHQKGIIHRDLKPSNILVNSEEVPKIIDFGVARATDSDMAVTTLQTDIGQLIGTLQYMSPEQCDADPHDLDIRSDVYALGVVLYELLTESLPYDLSHIALHEAVRVIREETPARPSSYNKKLRGDVETISLKALEKDRTRRYNSAEALGNDILNYLQNRPINARPTSAVYIIRKFATRHKGMMIAAAAILLSLTAGIVGTTSFAIIARQQRSIARENETLAQEQKQAAQESRDEAIRLQAIAEDREQVATQRGIELQEALSELEQRNMTLMASSERVGFLLEKLQKLEGVSPEGYVGYGPYFVSGFGMRFHPTKNWGIDTSDLLDVEVTLGEETHCLFSGVLVGGSLVPFALRNLPTWCGKNTRFHISALESIGKAVKDRLLEEGLFNVSVIPNPAHIERGTGQDLRPIEDDYLEFRVTAGYIDEIEYGQSRHGFNVEWKSLGTSEIPFAVKPPMKVPLTVYWLVSSWPTDITPMDDEHMMWIEEHSPLQIDEVIRCPDLLAFLNRASVHLGRRVHALIEMNEGRHPAFGLYTELGPSVNWVYNASVYRLKYVSMPLESADQSMIVNVIGGTLREAIRERGYGKATMDAYARMISPEDGDDNTLEMNRIVIRDLLIKAHDELRESRSGKAITPEAFSDVLAEEQYAIAHQYFKDFIKVLEEARKLGPTRNDIEEFKVYILKDSESRKLVTDFLLAVVAIFESSMAVPQD